MARFYKRFWSRRDNSKPRLGEDVKSKEYIDALEKKNRAREEAELMSLFKDDEMAKAFEEAEKGHKKSKKLVECEVER